MKVEFTVEEGARLQQVADALAEPVAGDNAISARERQVFGSAARKLRGALERSGARVDGHAWTVRLRRGAETTACPRCHGAKQAALGDDCDLCAGAQSSSSNTDAEASESDGS